MQNIQLKDVKILIYYVSTVMVDNVAACGEGLPQPPCDGGGMMMEYEIYRMLRESGPLTSRC